MTKTNKKSNLLLRAYLASVSPITGKEKLFLDLCQIVEFKDPVLYGYNAKFNINGSENVFIWYSQLNRLIAITDDMGNFVEWECTDFPMRGEQKGLLDVDVQDFFWKEVNGKIYKVVSVKQSIVLNNRSKTLENKGLRKYTD
ncbi:MAG: hypothetical protein IKX51_03760, partial [Bacteroidales bacterium]|nr:hypothetical protein [Bacteroidales bacterium]